ncbi:histone protein [Candidatus Burkholderia humilis]|nr:histone protein [Candidatus Burkholderia humilis]
MMVSLKDVQSKIEKLQAQAAAMIKHQSASVVAKIHSMMDEYGLTLEDLKRERTEQTKTSRSVAGSSAAGTSMNLYRDPKSGAEWSGRGRAPGWIANARNRDKFLIDSNAPSVSATKKAPKPGRYVRGPQPPKYRDPVSGALWSGRGMAPGWLAAAKDRTKFLIDASVATPSAQPPSATADSDSAKAPATKKAVKRTAAAAQKTPSKKVAAKKVTSTATKAAAKKAGSKAAVKKATAKTTAAKKVVAKKAAAKKTGVKAAATKSVAKKTSGKKANTKTMAISEDMPESAVPPQSTEAAAENLAT